MRRKVVYVSILILFFGSLWFTVRQTTQVLACTWTVEGPSEDC